MTKTGAPFGLRHWSLLRASSFGLCHFGAAEKGALKNLICLLQIFDLYEAPDWKLVEITVKVDAGERRSNEHILEDSFPFF